VVGGPILSNPQFQVWVENPKLKYRDVSTRPLIYDLTHITLG